MLERDRSLGKRRESDHMGSGNESQGFTSGGTSPRGMLSLDALGKIN